MEEKAPLAHSGDEQVLPITGAPFIVFLGFDRSSSGISKQQIELFALGIPDYNTSETDSSRPPHPFLKQKLNPHVVMDLPRSIFFAALGSSVYCFSNVEALAFDASCPFRGAPPPTVARCYPYAIVLDDKLYVMAGLMYNNEKARGNFHWMEVFDPKLGKWKTLTNPPVEINTDAMMVTRGPRNQILVIALIPSSYGGPNCLVLTYDVKTNIWSYFDNRISKLFAGGGCEPTSQTAPIPKVNGILYWVKFGDCNDLVVHAYDLYNDDCFEGILNMLQEVFGKREYLYHSCMASPPGLIHLCDHKFCLPLQSWSKNEKNRDMRRHFLYCVVLNISPIFDGNEELHNDIRDLFNPKKLHVSVLSSERYPMDHGVKILDTFLWNGSSL